MNVLTVAAILLNRQRHVLLQQRDEKPGVAFGGYWTLPGGRVEQGERPDDAIHRELQEELGLTLSLTPLRVYVRPHEPDPRVAQPSPQAEQIFITQHIYTGQIDRDLARLTPTEGQVWRFFTPTNLDTLAIAYGFKALLNGFFAADAGNRP